MNTGSKFLGTGPASLALSRGALLGLDSRLPRPPSTSFHTLRMASFVDRPRRYPKLASSNTGSKIGSNRLSNACWHTRS